MPSRRSNSNLPPLTHTADPYVSRSVTIWMFGDRRRPGLSVPFGALAEIDKPLCVPQRQGWHGMASDFGLPTAWKKLLLPRCSTPCSLVRLLAATHSMRRKVTGLAVTGSQGRATSSATTRTRNGPSAPSPSQRPLGAGVPMPTGGGTDKWPSPPPPLLG